MTSGLSPVVTAIRVGMLSAALGLVVPARAYVDPPLVCDGVESLFGNRTLSPVDLMCISLRLVPVNNSTTHDVFDAAPLAGRRVSVLFQIDTWNTSEDSHWFDDGAGNAVEIRVSGTKLTPSMFPIKARAASSWKRVGKAYGLMVRSDLFPAGEDEFTRRTVYVAELGASGDPARLGDYPFRARMRLTPQDAARVRRDAVFQADGWIVAAPGLPILYCGDFVSVDWREDPWSSPTKNCAFSVRFDYFAVRLMGSGQILSEWHREP